MSVATAVLALVLAGAGDAPEVPHPSLDGMEPAVAQQLGDLRRRLAQGLAAGEADAALYGEVGRHYHAYGLFEAAEACYRNARRLEPDDFRWPYLLGVLQQTDNRPEEAARSLERALAGPDKFYPALVRLGQLYLTLGRADDAARVLEPARRHAPGDPALLAVLGELALAQGRPGDVVVHLSEALRLRPRATRLHYPLGMALRAQGKLDEAREHLARAGGVGVRPQDPLLDQVLALRRGERAYMIDGHLAFRSGDFAGAVENYRRAVDASAAESLGPLLNLAAAQAKLERLDDAVYNLERALRLAPDDVRVLYNVGVMLAHVGRAAEAEPLLRRLLAQAPEDQDARLALALTLLALERASEALEILASVDRVEASRCAELGARLARLAGVPDAGVAARAAAERARLTLSGPCAAPTRD